MANSAKRHLLSPSPHFVSPVTTPRIMGTVILSLLPVTAWGVYLFGLPALRTILVSVVSAVIAESLFRLAIREKTRVGDLSAIITGLLLALVIPPLMPLWMTALGAAFSVIVAKEFFGGLGANVFNPALIGRAFLLMSFPAAMTTWNAPFGKAAVAGASAGVGAVDVVTTPTPLGIMHSGKGIAGVGQNLYDLGLSASPNYHDTLWTLFMGNRAGCIGETSIFLILAGFLFLLATRIIDWRAPLALVAAAFVTAWGLGLDPVFTILSGGVVFGAVFMATDYVTSPVTTKGKWLFGAGAGIIAILIRKFGDYPEGASYGILIMNTATPFLNKLVDRKFGYRAPAKEARK